MQRGFYEVQHYFTKIKTCPNSEHTLLHQSFMPELYTSFTHWKIIPKCKTGKLFLSAKLDNFTVQNTGFQK